MTAWKIFCYGKSRVWFIWLVFNIIITISALSRRKNKGCLWTKMIKYARQFLARRNAIPLLSLAPPEEDSEIYAHNLNDAFSITGMSALWFISYYLSLLLFRIYCHEIWWKWKMGFSVRVLEKVRLKFIAKYINCATKWNFLLWFLFMYMIDTI